MDQTYLRGDLYYADLGRGLGSEQQGNRPVVIIQNDVGNRHSPTVIVAAISSKVGVKAKLPTHYYMEAGSGLVQPSIVLLEQIRTIDKRRLSNYIGKLDERHIHGINHALAISIVKASVVQCLFMSQPEGCFGVIRFSALPPQSLIPVPVIFLIVVIVAPQYLDSVHTDGRPTDLVMTFSVAGGKILDVPAESRAQVVLLQFVPDSAPSGYACHVTASQSQ